MKSTYVSIAAAVLLVGCGPSEADRALFKAAAGVELGDTSVRLSGVSEAGNIEAVKQHLAAGADVDAKGGGSPGRGNTDASRPYREPVPRGVARPDSVSFGAEGAGD